MEFVKIEGLGNDYLFLDGIRAPLPGDLPELARRMSDRHFGVGSDGIILVERGESAPFRMRIFNADGSEAEMCGNGIRGFAKYVYEAGYTTERRIHVETGAGLIVPEVFPDDRGRVNRVRVDMGRPRFRPDEIPYRGEGEAPLIDVPLEIDGETYRVTLVSMGNPHAVLFVEDAETAPVTEIGPRIEHHPAFPNRTNVEFVQVNGPEELTMRVWERGSGVTLACGTGAAASLVAASLIGRSGRRATLHLLGGDLLIEWSEEDEHVYMTGPTREVFRGRYAPR